MASWEDVIKDSDEVKVFESLADSNWDFRSLDGISRATGLQTDDIVRIRFDWQGTEMFRVTRLFPDLPSCWV